jgi:NADPH2:quinone reductase
MVPNPYRKDATMRAWQVTRNGEPRDVMTLAEVPDPEPGPQQLLVRVRAAALNFPDVLLCRGQYQVRPPLPFTPGVELCGEVLAIGHDVGGFAPGDRVIGTPTLPHGALGELAVVAAADAYPAPDSLDDGAAAAMHIAYQTAWFGLHRRAGLRSGETLLVNAAAGGVGSAAVQLGKAAGARVVAVVGGAEKAKVAAELGADVVIDRTEGDVVAAIREVTGRHGADVVFDPVGGSGFAAATKCVAFEGRIIVVGFASGTIPAAPLAHALVKNYSLLGLHWGLYRLYDAAAVSHAHATLTALAADDVVAPLVSGRLDLGSAPQGLTRLAAGETVGRVVVEPV